MVRKIHHPQYGGPRAFRYDRLPARPPRPRTLHGYVGEHAGHLAQEPGPVARVGVYSLYYIFTRLSAVARTHGTELAPKGLLSHAGMAEQVPRVQLSEQLAFYRRE